MAHVSSIRVNRKTKNNKDDLESVSAHNLTHRESEFAHTGLKCEN